MDEDQLYLHLHGARERLCLAQMLVSPDESAALGRAVAEIDRVGSTLAQWSADDQDHLL